MTRVRMHMLTVALVALSQPSGLLTECAPEFGDGPAISVESWLSGQGECRADEAFLMPDMTPYPSQMAGQAADDESCMDRPSLPERSDQLGDQLAC